MAAIIGAILPFLVQIVAAGISAIVRDSEEAAKLKREFLKTMEQVGTWMEKPARMERSIEKQRKRLDEMEKEINGSGS